MPQADDGLRPAVPPREAVSVLAVSPTEEDHLNLDAIFRHSNWKIHQAGTCAEAMNFLDGHSVGVVICECRLPDGDWKKLLDEMQHLPCPPPVVVSSELADDCLWGEVLNVGGYDVLVKPFDQAEVTRIVSLAWLHWKESLKRTNRAVASATSLHGSSQSERSRHARHFA